jgi:ParB-like chromosome segregation protein Spo0J
MTKMPTVEQAGFNSKLTEPIEYPDEYKPLYIPTKLLKPNSLNPRTDADIAADDELRQSIGIRGVETPLHVRPLAEPDEDGHRYEVYDGDRRLRAAINTKLAKVPVIIRQKTDDEVIEFGMVSTIRRGHNDAENGYIDICVQTDSARVLGVYKKRYGHLTDEDAQREGYGHIEEFKTAFEARYGPIQEEESVFVVQFSPKG